VFGSIVERFRPVAGTASRNDATSNCATLRTEVFKLPNRLTRRREARPRQVDRAVEVNVARSMSARFVLVAQVLPAHLG